MRHLAHCLSLLALSVSIVLPMAGSSHAAVTLTAYRDEAELATALDRWRAAAQLRQQARVRNEAGMAQSMAAPAPAAAAMPLKAGADRAAEASDSITNVQTAGVDEGGIVKRAGDHLIILRRGRLFTVRVGGDQLQPVSQLDAYAPGSDPRGAWYDELLISGNTVVVVGYSYARGGTEIGLFDLADNGGLAYRATYHLRSFDYYSARNYASRLIGQKLVFYSPTVLQPWGPPWAQMMPAMRRWSGQAVASDFDRILPATRIFRTDDDFEPGQPLALHTVTSCDLGAAPLRCDSSAVLGPVGRVFYVSAGSVYVWTSQSFRRGSTADREPTHAPQSAVFRLPLDGTAPSGLKTAGVPTDQMSFLEDSQGHLNVLLREQGSGEGMFGAFSSRGRTALLRVPLADFGDGRSAAARERYRRLPGPDAAGLQNRFVGDWLLWGAGDSAWALRYGQPGDAVALEPQHAVERIEAMGENALLVGNSGADLHFSAVRLPAARSRHESRMQAGMEARIEGHHAQVGSRQGETRSHGFFYRATGSDEGLLGLPVVSSESTRHTAYPARAEPSAAVVVLRQRGLSFTALGDLSAQAGPRVDDGCKASCTDWYGNARPIFLGDRVIALMGYELVEGRLQGQGRSEQIVERRRVNFSPRAKVHLQMRPTPFD